MTEQQKPAAFAPRIVDRVKNILLQPRVEWDRIAAEPANVNALYIRYVAPLAAIAAVATAIGWVVFGYGALGFYVRLDPVSGAVQAVVQFVMSMVSVFALGLIINALAPSFGSQADPMQAHKVAAYSATASFVAQLFAIFPPLSVLGVLGLYSLVLLFMGLPRLMKTQDDKRIGYFVTVLVVSLVLGLVISAVTTTVRGSLPRFGGGWSFGQQERAPRQSEEGRVQLPGGGSVDLGELQRGAEQLEQSVRQAAQVRLDPDALQATLPETLDGGFTRTSVSSSAAGDARAGLTQAEADYARGDDTLKIEITHMGAMSGVATLGAAMGVQTNQEDADGYARTHPEDGRTVIEEVRRNARTVKYGVITRTGVSIIAEGRGPGLSIEDARAAVNAVGVERIEAMSAPEQQ